MCGCMQTFAEKLFARLQKGSGEKFETRMAIMTLVSRVVGVHKLLLLNFYPFMQRYLQPHQRDVPQLLATLVQVQRPPLWSQNTRRGFTAAKSVFNFLMCRFSIVRRTYISAAGHEIALGGLTTSYFCPGLNLALQQSQHVCSEV